MATEKLVLNAALIVSFLSSKYLSGASWPSGSFTFSHSLHVLHVTGHVKLSDWRTLCFCLIFLGLWAPTHPVWDTPPNGSDCIWRARIWRQTLSKATSGTIFLQVPMSVELDSPGLWKWHDSHRSNKDTLLHTEYSLRLDRARLQENTELKLTRGRVGRGWRQWSEQHTGHQAPRALHPFRHEWRLHGYTLLTATEDNFAALVSHRSRLQNGKLSVPSFHFFPFKTWFRSRLSSIYSDGSWERSKDKILLCVARKHHLCHLKHTLGQKEPSRL